MITRKRLERMSEMIESGRIDIVISRILEKIESGEITIESIPQFCAVQKKTPTLKNNLTIEKP